MSILQKPHQLPNSIFWKSAENKVILLWKNVNAIILFVDTNIHTIVRYMPIQDWFPSK
jgi:hypothetical protein